MLRSDYSYSGIFEQYEYTNIFPNLVFSHKIYFKDFLHLDPLMTDENNQLLEQFGVILKQLRIEKKLTLLDLEVRTGVSEGDISRIENGKKNFTFTTLVKLAKGLDIPVSKLLAKFNA